MLFVELSELVMVLDIFAALYIYKVPWKGPKPKLDHSGSLVDQTVNRDFFYY